MILLCVFLIGDVIMAKQKYPVLYVKSVYGSMFKHCSINQTLYFKIFKDEKRKQEDPLYAEYMEYVDNEVYDAIINKYIISSPNRVTNNRISFLIFRSNIDMSSVKQFCQAMLDELQHFTGIAHKAQYANLETMLMEMDKEPSLLKASKVGDKLTETDILQETMETMLPSSKVQDNGILTPFDIFVRSKQEEQDQKQKQLHEDVVAW